MFNASCAAATTPVFIVRTLPTSKQHCLLARLFRFSAFVLGMLLWTLSAFAQTTASTGQITGVVTDPNQAVLSSTQVVLTNTQTQEKITVVTNNQGVYVFSDLQPGTYVVEVDAKGFKPSVSPALQVGAGQSVKSDFALTLAQATETVNVSAGSENAYRVENVKPGSPLGPIPIVNLPYSVHVVPRQLIDDTQSRNFKEISKYLPLISFREQQGPEILRPESRGMQGTNMQNDRKDGMGFAVTTPSALEEYEQLEVFTGLGGALYGPTQPSGLFNFVTKRPTDEPFRELEVDYESKSVGTIHADLGGRFGPNKGEKRMFGYRTNLVLADGTSYVTDSQLRRQLAAMALDVRPFAHTAIEGNFSYYELYQHGDPGWFIYTPVLTPSAKSPYTILPANAPDPTRQGYGQSFAGVDMENQIGEVRVRHDFSPNWQLMLSVLHQIANRNINTPVNVLTNTSATGSQAGYFANPGFYLQYLENVFQATLSPRFQVKSDLGYLTGKFKTWGIGHDIVIGSTGYRFATWNAVAANVLTGTPLAKTVLCPAGEDASCTFTGSGTPPTGKFRSASIANPLFAVPPAVGIPSQTKTNPSNGIYVNSILHQQGFSLDDTITLTPRWLLRGAASQDWTWTNNYSLSPICNPSSCSILIGNPTTPNFESQGVSSSASILFKPRENMTIYGTFADSLQAPDTLVVSSPPNYVINSGKALAPYRDIEEEVGYKLVSRRVNFSTALFRIKRPYIGNPVALPVSACPPLPAGFTTCEINEITGYQINYGAEGMLSGRVLDSLMVVAGITVLNPKLTDTGIPATNDKTFVGIPDYHSNILAEYHLPVWTGAFLNFDWQHVGRRPVDDVNSTYAPQFNTFDLGFRYATKIEGRVTNFRVWVDNVTDVHYWSTINPGSLAGLSNGSYLGHLGEPRLVLASVRFDF
jgi:iron complex outermembrane receptor protein